MGIWYALDARMLLQIGGVPTRGPLVVAFLMSGARNMAAQLSLPKPTLGACGKMFMRQQRLVLDQRAEGHGG